MKGLSAPSYHVAQVESLSTVSKVPETLHPCSTKHHRELILVGPPEQLLVRYVDVGLCLGPAAHWTPKQENKK